MFKISEGIAVGTKTKFKFRVHNTGLNFPFGKLYKINNSIKDIIYYFRINYLFVCNISCIIFLESWVKMIYSKIRV